MRTSSPTQLASNTQSNSNTQHILNCTGTHTVVLGNPTSPPTHSPILSPPLLLLPYMASNVDKARKSWSTLIGPETDETVNPLTSSSEKGETSATIITIGGDPRTRSPTHTTSSSTSSLPSPSKTNKTRRETHAVTPGSRAKKKKGQRKSSPLLSSSAAPPKQSRSRKSTETSRRSTKTHHNRMSRTSISLTAHHFSWTCSDSF